jgi:hypothetical protein
MGWLIDCFSLCGRLIENQPDALKYIHYNFGSNVYYLGMSKTEATVDSMEGLGWLREEQAAGLKTRARTYVINSMIDRIWSQERGYAHHYRDAAIDKLSKAEDELLYGLIQEKLDA